MRTRVGLGRGVMLAAVAAAWAWLSAGCGEASSIFGGECVSGYARCAGGCCPEPRDGAGVEASAEDAQGDTGVPGDDSGVDWDASRDGSIRNLLDGASDAPETAPPIDSGAVDGSTPEAAAPEAGGDDGGGEAAVCLAPSMWCSGVCTDVTSDPLNCGSCGNVCPSQLCTASLCVGSTSGAIVYIGHAFSSYGPGPAGVLSNAAFMSRSNPLRILSYERYARATAKSNVHSALDDSATQLGRKLQLTSTVSDGDIPATLSIQGYDVLLVLDQPDAAPGALGALGSSWASTLATFTQQHGIVVVLDGGDGVGGMPAFTTQTALLQVGLESSVSSTLPLQVLAPGDAVGIGVVSPYAAPPGSVSFQTEANGGPVVYVVGGMGGGDAGAGGPVVVHKVL